MSDILWAAVWFVAGVVADHAVPAIYTKLANWWADIKAKV